MLPRILLVVLLCMGSVSAQTPTLLEQFQLAQNPDFIGRVKMSLIRAAISVSNEATNAANHQRRVALAVAVLRSPDVFANALAYGIAAAGTITTLSSDATINLRVDTVWDAYAGVD